MTNDCDCNSELCIGGFLDAYSDFAPKKEVRFFVYVDDEPREVVWVGGGSNGGAVEIMFDFAE